MKNSKGMSTIVATLIVILLVIVAVGLVWVVVRNVVNEGVEQIDMGSKCNLVTIQPTVFTNSSGTVYSVTVERSAGGDEIAGIKMIFTNATGDSNYVYTRSGNIAPLATVTEPSITVTTPTNLNKVEIVPYFTTESGEEYICTGGAYKEK